MDLKPHWWYCYFMIQYTIHIHTHTHIDQICTLRLRIKWMVNDDDDNDVDGGVYNTIFPTHHHQLLYHYCYYCYYCYYYYWCMCVCVCVSVLFGAHAMHTEWLLTINLPNTEKQDIIAHYMDSKIVIFVLFVGVWWWCVVISSGSGVDGGSNGNGGGSGSIYTKTEIIFCPYTLTYCTRFTSVVVLQCIQFLCIYVCDARVGLRERGINGKLCGCRGIATNCTAATTRERQGGRNTTADRRRGKRRNEETTPACTVPVIVYLCMLLVGR